ncbi:lactosylceramide 4-alpha-galactosyltransferase-like isoform X1 [Cydia strobilella]|uniref:lactosylceramide 4-alpha-galactosyltransferase-like isoform X1 n=2 Tax=Cydia strobilella TaxID=1100964 RepID=UPI003007EC0D
MYKIYSVFYICKIARMINKLIIKLRRRRVLTSCVVLVILCGYIVLQTPLSPDLYFIHWNSLEDISCHYIDLDNTLPRAESEEFQPPSRSIFFHETSCKGYLDSRQACAVESAARAHPGWQINVLFAAPVHKNSLKNGSLSVLRNFTNIRLSRVHITNYAKRTPLESMVSGGALNRTRWRISHTSDVLRYLSLYKFGGVYLDLDVVVAKALDPLVRNWAARETDTAVAAGALAFSRDELGRSVAEAAIRDIKSNYRGDNWGNNGPGVITRILKKYCSTSNLSQMSAATCNGFEVYGPQFFYPVVYWKGFEYFEPGEIKLEDTAYIFHVWNKLTSDLPVHKDSPYAKLARKYCPTVYNLYGKDFLLPVRKKP